MNCALTILLLLIFLVGTMHRAPTLLFCVLFWVTIVIFLNNEIKKAIDKRYTHQLPEINLTIKTAPLSFSSDEIALHQKPGYRF